MVMMEDTKAMAMEDEGAPKRRRRLGTLLALLAATTIGGGLYVSLGGGRAVAEDGKGEAGKDGAKAPVPVEVVAAANSEVSAWLTATANLVCEHEVTVAAETEGRIARLDVEEGDRIVAGQPLARLEREELDILVEKARVRAANARAAWERGRSMNAEALLSEQELDRLTLEKRVAEQELAEAEWRLERATIRSPLAGIVVKRLVQVGQSLRPGQEVFRVADLDPLLADVHLPEREVLPLRPGQDVRLRLAADREIVFAGRIRRIAPVVETATGTVKVTVEAGTPPPSVRPGSFVVVEILKETRPGAVVVPREAVLRELGDAWVFVAETAGPRGTTFVAKRRTVELGLEEDGRIEVTNGVAVGDRIVVAGQGGLRDGATVEVIAAADSEEAS